MCTIRFDVSILTMRLIGTSKKRVKNNNVLNSGFGYFKLKLINTSVL